MPFTESNNYGTSNGTTDVTVVSAPASGARKLVRTITVFNTGATTRTATLKLDDGTNERQFARRALSQYESLVFNDLLVLDSTTEKIELVLDGGTTEVHWTAHFATVS